MKVAASTALVTGGNRGIGEAFVHALIEAGTNKVYIACRDKDNASHLVAQYGSKVEAITLDVTSEDQVKAAAEACADTNIIINNAGYFHNETLMGADSMAGARLEMETNYFGLLSMSRYFSPVFAKHSESAIINVLSAGAIVAIPLMGGYSPSKFAARALTTNLRAELKSQGTQVGCLIVGSIDTRMASHVAGQKEKPSTVAKAGIRAIEKNLPEMDTDAFAINVRAALQRDPALQERQMAAMLNMTNISTGR